MIVRSVDEVRQRPFRAQRQLRTEWCWAALCNSVEHFFDGTSGRTQCEIVGRLLHEHCCGELQPEQVKQCNRPHFLDRALNEFGWLAVPEIRRPIDFDRLRAEIDNGRPVCLFIGWLDDDGNVSGGHFIAIKGYKIADDGEKFVSIEDPLWEDYDISWDVLRARRGGYRDGRGRWDRTILVRDARAQ
ncbi:MAG TPA: papain-like cysteine protease family protein [Bryobacteraceae bacterium]|nr:papain-like cysteine protease family protein [Bryobacteraceae bacterium]